MFLFAAHHRSPLLSIPWGLCQCITVIQMNPICTHLACWHSYRESGGVDFQHSWPLQLGSPPRRLASCLSFPCSIPSHLTPLHKHWCCSDSISWSREQIPLGEGINILTALGPFSSRHTTSAQRNCERRLGVCNFRERSFVLKEPCVQSALPSLESCQKIAGNKDKRQRRPSKAQHSTAGELQFPTTPKPWAAWAPRGLRITQDNSGALWQRQKLLWAADYLHCAPAATHPLHSRDLPYHLDLHLSWNTFSYGNFMFWSFCLG